MTSDMKSDGDLRQWVIWPPAMAAMVALVGGMYALRAFDQPGLWQAVYGILGLVAVWWLLPRLAFKLWREGDALYWRWGQLHQGPLRQLPLVEIAQIEVGELPDKPTLPYRVQGTVELHGGNFTPTLNRGVKLSLRDGRVVWFGLPQPEKFATALQKALPAPITTL